MKIDDRRGRTLTIAFVDGPHEGILSSTADESQANMIWLLTNYGRSGSEFTRMSAAVLEQHSGDQLDTFPPIKAARYRVSERVESETEIRLICRYKRDL